MHPKRSFRARMKPWLWGTVSWLLVLLLQGSFGLGLLIPQLSMAQTVQASAPMVEQLIQEGQQLFQVGQYAEARDRWRAAQQLYSSNSAEGRGDRISQLLIYQSQALQSQGLSRRACDTLLQALELPVQDCSSLQPEDLEGQTFTSGTRLVGLRLLGESLQMVGQLTTAKVVLEQAAENSIVPAESAVARLALIDVQSAELRNQDRAALQQELGDLGQVNQDNPIQSPEPAALNSTSRYVQDLSSLLSEYETLSRDGAISDPVLRTRALANRLRLGVEGLEVLMNSLRLLQAEAAPLSYDQLVRTKFLSKQKALLLQSRAWGEAVGQSVQQLQPLLEQIGSDRTTIYTYINLAQSHLHYLQLRKENPFNTASLPPLFSEAEIIAQLKTAQVLARNNQDVQAEAYATGYLGELYGAIGEVSQAEANIREALALSQTGNSADLSYRWQWQMGRLLKEGGKREKALQAYKGSIQGLDNLRSDLVATNRNVQFSFRDSVEPVYREYVGLLLQGEGNTSNTDLKEARKVIERLQLAEIDNYFREPCSRQQSPIDTLTGDGQAVLYSIVLPDRLELILKLPGGPDNLREFSSAVSQETLERTAVQMLEAGKKNDRGSFDRLAGQLYQWMIAPLQSQLMEQDIETLIFVLDSQLSSLPISGLYNTNTQRYLIEDFSLAIAPSIRLQATPETSATEVTDRSKQVVLAAAMTEERPGFPALETVEDEIEFVKTLLPGEFLIDETFTKEEIAQRVRDRDFSIIHLATHGTFGSTAEQTYILDWEGEINVNELGKLLRTQTETQVDPIDLLILSACQTAKGDRRAALGIAGAAFRAGAASTVATLWNVNDALIAETIQTFYNKLLKDGNSKAEALRQAQLQLRQYKLGPNYWAPFVLVGDWS